MRPQTFIAITFGLLLLTSCKHECRVVKESYLDKKEKEVYIYPDCDDTTYYLQQSFHHNGQMSREGHFRNERMEGKFKSWASNGTQTGSWEVVDGLPYGVIRYWYDNGNKKSEIVVANGFEKHWYQNGKLEKQGHNLNEIPTGDWLFWEDDGSLAEKQEYRDGQLISDTLYK